MQTQGGGAEITFIIPGEPVAWARPRAHNMGKFIRFFNAPAQDEYKDAVAIFARKAMAGLPPLSCPVYLKVGIFRPIPESKSKAWKEAAQSGELLPTNKPDADNYLKIIMDALNGTVLIDDVQVTDAFVKKRYNDVPFVKVTVIPLAKYSSQEKPPPVNQTQIGLFQAREALA